MSVHASLGVMLGALLAGCGRPASAPAPAALCPPQTYPLAGACLEHDEAVAYCGAGAKPEAGGCARVSCAADEARDVSSGACVPKSVRGVRADASQADAGSNATPPCPAETDEVVAFGEHRVCLPRAETCGRGAHVADGTCRVDPPCPPGSLAEASGACRVVVARDGDETLLDVGTWLRLALGPDGGAGSATVCGPLAERPWLAGIGAHETGEVDVTVDLVFPDNQVRDVRVTTVAERYDPHNASPAPRLNVDTYLDPLWRALRLVGGIANAASATVHVRCAIVGGFEMEGPKHGRGPS